MSCIENFQEKIQDQGEDTPATPTHSTSTTSSAEPRVRKKKPLMDFHPMKIESHRRSLRIN
jgi:hypothetical protein